MDDDKMTDEALSTLKLLRTSAPSAEAKKHLIDLPIDYSSGDRVTSGGRSFVEHFRLGADGRRRANKFQ